jgi:hypothetical protein
MSRVAFLRTDQANEAEARRHYLGPASVTRASRSDVDVRLKTGAVVRATPALAFTYQPVEGDLVLVIGDAEGHYVIGVIHGSGRSTLELPGDVDVRAVGGVLRLSGDKGVEVAAPEVTVRAGALRTIAGAITETCSSLRRRVTELLSVHAGERHTVVDGTSYEQSKSATLVTEDKMTLNGKQIYLG